MSVAFQKARAEQEHYQRCARHEDAAGQKCWGSLRKGGLCFNRATCPAVPGFLPTCKVHSSQVKASARCKALMACGFNCDKLLQWEPHGYQLCWRHRKEFASCCLLKLPVEIRCRIYRLLLPDTDIPARFSGSTSLTTDGERVYTAILRVNRQIHEEAARLLYGTNVFVVEVSEGMLSMCNKSSNYMQYVRYFNPL